MKGLRPQNYRQLSVGAYDAKARICPRNIARALSHAALSPCIIPPMITGPFSLNQQTPSSRPPVPLAFDPRPWPLVVLMLAGLLGVYFALRSASSADPLPSNLAAQPVALTVPALPEIKPALEQGVTLTFQQGNKIDKRSARLLSLYVPEKTAPTPFLSPGPFTATFSGFVNLRLRGEFTFSVLGRGKVVVKINGQSVIEASGDDFASKSSALLKMEKGKNPIEVIYTGPEKGDAWLRVLRTSRDFPPEPVQPTVLSHDVADTSLRQATRLREGRELLANLRCQNCHAMAAETSGVHPMPELATDAPDLSTAGARLKQSWMAAWIANPKSLRPDASMPRLFHSADAAQAADLASYLATLDKPADAAAPESDDEAVTQGSQLFAALGCIGCHTKPDADEIDTKEGRIPLKFINAKFQPGALKAWLMHPQAHYRSARMPNFHLTDLEADRLIGYLIKNAKGEVPGNPKGDASKGRESFISAGCAACHTDGSQRAQQPGTQTKTMAQLLEASAWNRGCLGPDDATRGKAPDFALTDEQRSALKAIAAAGLASLQNDVLPEYAERAVRHLQCTACHSRDEVEDRWSNLSDEVADIMPPEVNVESDQTDDAANGPRLFVPRGLAALHGGDKIVISGDQTRPPLTWTGEKLRPEWMAKFINGEIHYKPRYWLRARMPAFATHGQAIAQGLALEHGVAPTSTAPPAPKQDLADIGQKLVGRDGGFQCITCHSIVDHKAVSPFEAPGPNLMHVSERVNHDYYIRWMRKPMQFQPGTKMPVFGENGKTTLREILDGDADKQFDAIWNYILQGEKMTPPE
jgi:mono/diheme cytochrome c family protein